MRIARLLASMGEGDHNMERGQIAASLPAKMQRARLGRIVDRRHVRGENMGIRVDLEISGRI
jgi:hypothetical protein